MILECPSCHAKYVVPNGLFAAGTRQVRCARCKHEWQARPPNNIDVVGMPSPPPPPPVVTPPPAPAPDSEKPVAKTESAPTPKKEEKKPLASSPPPAAVTKSVPVFIEAVQHGLTPNLPAIIKKFHWKKYAVLITGVIALLCLLLSSCVLERQSLVKSYPSLRGLYESIGLSIPKTGEGLVFDNVSSELRYDSGTMKLFVDGVIHNTTDQTQFIPDIKAAARAPDQSIIQSWWVDAPAATIPAGGEVPFHTEIGATTQKTIEDVYLEFTSRDEKHDAGQ